MSRNTVLIIFVALVLTIFLGLLIYKNQNRSAKLIPPTIEQIREKENGLQTIPNKPSLPQ